MRFELRLAGLIIWFFSLLGWTSLAGWLPVFPEPLNGWIAVFGLYTCILLLLVKGDKK